ncbi:branched-chain amino acid ABC transporter permease [Alkaliphilus serpentinus]|uniref:Branched-chain amino acid ABC transporter permease n=1 Tax=Alkaliphilus serpentinus TaxID=1482731 RepID=A0A833HL04_9FIRM|nr:branched-chain amino acid ABC transporter permease [Alkaliphilus serpentinus]KAB3524429.1 branched-chain amino acid ABC transporter permease [Alkaliphilus serpentinus]
MKLRMEKSSLTKILSLGGLLIALMVVPHFAKTATVTLLSRIFILAVYGMSYDILRGYTGFINLGHALFFGSGAYIAGILFTKLDNTLGILLLVVVLTIIYCSVAAFIMGKIVLRNGSVIAAAMITLALGEIVRNMAERWRSVTGGADGLPFKIPPIFRDRMAFYYYALIFMILMTLILRQFLLSPTGRVLLAVRENEQRARFLGFNTDKYKMIGLQVAAISSGLAGVMFGLLNRFANTDLLSVQQTLNALLITLVGGTGTLYGAIVGSGFIAYVQNTLLNLRSVHPIFERWLLFFGAMYVIVVLFMPSGFIGLWNKLIAERKTKKKMTTNLYIMCMQLT